MDVRRLLTDEEERSIALTRFCGVSLDFILDKWGISKDTLVHSIVGDRSKEWHDPLVEFYRETDFRRRSVNAAHLYLSFSGEDIGGSELVDERRDVEIARLVVYHMFNGGVQDVVRDLSIERYVKPRTEIERLVDDILTNCRTSFGFIDPLFVRVLRDQYEAGKGCKGEELFEGLREYAFDVVRSGGMDMTPRKVSAVKKAIKSLDERAQHVIRSRYDINGEGIVKLRDLGDEYGVKYQRIQTILFDALNVLRRNTTILNAFKDRLDGTLYLR
tara:strand:- start:1451 stop:2269 length:819 start_codon:yes stop_codon:yes gene_type:complete